MALCRASMAAVCIAGLVACSDDGDKKNPETDGSVNPDRDGGSNGNLDSGLDGSLIGKDATVLPDGQVIDPTPDGGDPVGVDGGDSGGALPCGGSCDDNIDCTIDSCVNGACEHRVDNDICAAGSSCNLTTGCQQGKACAAMTDCEDMDPCTTGERCNMQLARCEYDLLDRDGDGYPPASCGGSDCDDTRGLVNPSATESCNGRDDDCDGATDDNIPPVEGYVCTNGDVQCAEGYEECGTTQLFVCVNTQTDPANCGDCGQRCDTGESCVAGQCTCAATSTMCGGQLDGCADTTKSEAHCGSCGNACNALGQGGDFEACISGACVACGSENEPCCDTQGFDFIPSCATGLTCEGTPGAAGSKCTCAAGSTKCGDACVDLKTSNANCGACGNACEPGQRCVTEGATSACEACGGPGQRCCSTGLGGCRGGRVCGPDNTCVLSNAGGVGPGGG